MSKEDRYLMMRIYQRLTRDLEQLIKQAPAFEGDDELARSLGENMADLECKIKGLN